MSSINDKVSVLVLAFNRPVITKKVLAAIADYAPPKIYVAVDGPRPGRADDQKNCAAVIQAVAEWEAAHPNTLVIRLFREANLGCGRGVSTAINWFFSQEEMGIILEDDCLPNRSFFVFCEELLHRYKDHEEIMHIGGSNHLHGGVRIAETYYFSKYPQIWGWASWRRAWSKYNFDMPDLANLLLRPEFSRYYHKDLFLKTAQGELDTWDIQWIAAFLLNDGLSILPAGNFIRNLGFDSHGGAHLNKKPSWYDDRTTDIETIIHPPVVEQNVKADDFVFRTVYNPSLLLRARRKLRSFFKKS
jgi:hypothetical protein